MSDLRTIVLDGTLEHWRAHARALLAARVEPGAVRFFDPGRAGESVGEPGAGLPFGPEPRTPAPGAPERGTAGAVRADKALVRVLATAACHSEPDVWELLYRLLWRTSAAGGGELSLRDALDPDVLELERRLGAVRRDAHKLHAFVRFRRVESPADPGGERYVAWHRPLHRVLHREAGFFRRRFPRMSWSIFTPHESAHWDTRALELGPGADPSVTPGEDPLESLWLDYYASIFNPARVKLDAMRAEMPVRHWETLPETRAIPGMLADVPRRLEAMARSSRAVVDSAAPFVPASGDLEALRAALPACDGCELARNGTRPVFGEGPPDARAVLLGEQPGDEEERAGQPFVGPAGRVLDRLLERAGLDRGRLYLTNAVKHFHHGWKPAGAGDEATAIEWAGNYAHDPQGKRIHYRPRPGMVSRCQPWVEAELDRLKPEVLVCLGETAARSVLGRRFRLRDQRGVARSTRLAPQTLCTWHPAAILRARDAERERLERELLEDLRRAAALLGRAAS